MADTPTLFQKLFSLQGKTTLVIGASGGIGQPLSLLMKLNPRVTELALYDIRGGPGPLIRSDFGRSPWENTN